MIYQGSTLEGLTEEFSIFDDYSPNEKAKIVKYLNQQIDQRNTIFYIPNKEGNRYTQRNLAGITIFKRHYKDKSSYSVLSLKIKSHEDEVICYGSIPKFRLGKKKELFVIGPLSQDYESHKLLFDRGLGTHGYNFIKRAYTLIPGKLKTFSQSTRDLYFQQKYPLWSQQQDYGIINKRANRKAEFSSKNKEITTSILKHLKQHTMNIILIHEIKFKNLPNNDIGNQLNDSHFTLLEVRKMRISDIVKRGNHYCFILESTKNHEEKVIVPVDDFFDKVPSPNDSLELYLQGNRRAKQKINLMSIFKNQQWKYTNSDKIKPTLPIKDKNYFISLLKAYIKEKLTPYDTITYRTKNIVIKKGDETIRISDNRNMESNLSLIIPKVNPQIRLSMSASRAGPNYSTNINFIRILLNGRPFRASHVFNSDLLRHIPFDSYLDR